MPDVWYEDPPATASAQGLYSYAGLSHQGTLAFVAGQLSVGADGEVVGSGNSFRQVLKKLADVLKGAQDRLQKRLEIHVLSAQHAVGRQPSREA